MPAFARHPILLASIDPTRLRGSGLDAFGESLAEVHPQPGTDHAEHERGHGSDARADGPAQPSAHGSADQAQELFQFTTAFFWPRPVGLVPSISSINDGLAVSAGDTLFVEGVTRTAFSDTIGGTVVDEVFNGGGGDDLLNGVEWTVLKP